MSNPSTRDISFLICPISYHFGERQLVAKMTWISTFNRIIPPRWWTININRRLGTFLPGYRIAAELFFLKWLKSVSFELLLVLESEPNFHMTWAKERSPRLVRLFYLVSEMVISLAAIFLGTAKSVYVFKHTGMRCSKDVQYIEFQISRLARQFLPILERYPP